MIRQIQVNNLLSFGPDTPPLDLLPLNVLIGPNGSGKSNLIEAISLLQAAPKDLAAPVREGGGVQEWLWKGAPTPMARLVASVEYPIPTAPLYHELWFMQGRQAFLLTKENIGRELKPEQSGSEHGSHCIYKGPLPKAILWVGEEERELRLGIEEHDLSILSQRRDPEQYPELSRLASQYEGIRIYREWSFGRHSVLRLSQRADQRNDFLMEDCSNLGLVLNRLGRVASAKKAILGELRELYDGIDDFDVSVEGGTVQVFFHEGSFYMPATRLSDGTLRYLCLLSILCDPWPAPLICIEEPELGLHPDLLPRLAKLLKEAAERTQLVVTTHSEVLVDELTDTPDSVVVCEKVDGATQMNRLSKEALKVWLDKYSLGTLWRRGELGGNRW